SADPPRIAIAATAASGLVALAAGRATEAVELLGVAAEWERRLGWPYRAACLDLDLAQALTAAGAERDASAAHERAEPLEAEASLVRRADGGQSHVLAIASVGAPAALPDERSADEGEQAALLDLRLAERRSECLLDDLQCGARRREEHLVAPSRQPEGPTDAACDVEHVRAALVDPGGGHRSDELLQHRGGRA